jgi:ribose transport system ATP-binding protein
VTGAPTLEVRGLSKSYGPTRALEDVSFAVARGEMLGVLGQNGAGKSTLVKILAGVVQPSAGDVRVDGEPAELHSARAALERGIVLIPQELAYVRDLSVAENIVLGGWGARHSIVSRARMRRAAVPLAAAVGLRVRLDEPMSSLALADCQLVEIAKALSRDARVLLLDEPTAALSDAEIQRLFATLEELRRKGVAMIYISHRLDEMLARTDRVLVLRDGRVTDHRRTSSATRLGLIESMVGHDVGGPAVARSGATSGVEGTPLVSLRGVSHRGRGLRDVSFDVRRGEILGLFGVAGGGHETVALTLAGLLPHDEGRLFIDGREHPPLRTPRQARKAGVMYVPPERKTQGLVLGHSVTRNLTFPQLSRFARFGVMNGRAQERLVASAAERLDLRYSGPRQPVGHLSGGNQQKVMLASRIYSDPALLVIQEPSRGVDVAAREDIHDLLAEVAADGRTIVFATADVEEAVTLSGRLLVLRDGRLAATLEAEAKTQAGALEAAGRTDTED